MKMNSIEAELSASRYPGRGIVLGKSLSGVYAVIAYFIMGRSENSRNRIFVADGTGIRTRAFDESKMSDSHLIIYSPLRTWEETTIVSNGDQTDTIYDAIARGGSFEEALRGRQFEDDAPNFTPRISGFVRRVENGCRYALSILKSDNGNEKNCLRYFFDYENPQNGSARFIHTYSGDAENGKPLPSFDGEPKLLEVPTDNIAEFTMSVWNSLDEENRISLFTRFIDIETGNHETRIINKLEE